MVRLCFMCDGSACYRNGFYRGGGIMNLFEDVWDKVMSDMQKQAEDMALEKDRECKRLTDMGFTDITIVEFTYDFRKWFIMVGNNEYLANINMGEGI